MRSAFGSTSDVELGRSSPSHSLLTVTTDRDAVYPARLLRPPERSCKMDSRSSGRVSVLPVEMQHHILGFCDRATLAVTSRVSLAFLELSAPLLYADIELIGLHRVEELFCHRVSLRSNLPHASPVADEGRHTTSASSRPPSPLGLGTNKPVIRPARTPLAPLHQLAHHRRNIHHRRRTQPVHSPAHLSVARPLRRPARPSPDRHQPLRHRRLRGRDRAVDRDPQDCRPSSRPSVGSPSRPVQRRPDPRD